MCFKKFENEKIISQIVGISWACDQNGDSVSKNGKSCHICSMGIKKVLIEYKKYGILSICSHMEADDMT